MNHSYPRCCLIVLGTVRGPGGAWALQYGERPLPRMRRTSSPGIDRAAWGRTCRLPASAGLLPFTTHCIAASVTKQDGVFTEQCMPWRPKCCWPWVRPRVRVCGPCPGSSWHSSPLFRLSSLVQGICVDEGAVEARARCASLARQGHGPRRRQVYDRDEAAGGAAGKGRCSPARCSYTSGG